MFITFEGGEGTGKSTQVKLLAERLRAEGRDVVLTREPGGTPEAEALRNLLVSGDTARWTADEELLLNFAARGSHIRGVIQPALDAGKIVICDRFVDSSFVYQCVAGGASEALFAQLIDSVVPRPIPDFTFVLDIDPSEAMARAKLRNDGDAKHARADRFERKGAEFHEKVRQGFVTVAKAQQKRCHLIDASGSAEAVAARIWGVLHG